MVSFEAMLFVMYGSSLFSSVLLSLRGGMSLYDVCMFMSLFGFGMGMFDSFHIRGMMLFSDVLYMLVRYASPCGPMRLM